MRVKKGLVETLNRKDLPAAYLLNILQYFFLKNEYFYCMKVILADSAGFCMGVRRAVNITIDIAQKTDGKVVTYGPLVHNNL